MLRRLLVGLVIGLVVGGLLAVGLVKGLGVVTLTAVFAYLAAALTGALVGLVAGKPIWSAGGQIEAGLKAAFGALIAAGGMFALRQWVHINVPELTLPGVGLVHGEIGSVPFAALPLLGAILGGFYEADNTPEPTENEKPAAKRAALPPNARAANGKARVSTGTADEIDDDEAEAPGKRARR